LFEWHWNSKCLHFVRRRDDAQRSAVATVTNNEGKKMAETKAEASQGALENALSDLVRRAVRAEIQEIVGLIRQQDRLLTIDEVAQQLSVSKDWVYRNGKKLTFSKKLGRKMVRFSEVGLQKWLKER